MIARRLSRDDLDATSAPARVVPYAETPRDLDAALALTRRGPWLLRGLFDDTSLEALRAAALHPVRDVAVPVAPVRDGRVVIDSRRGLATEPRRLDALVASLRAGRNDGYVAARRVELPPELDGAFPSPGFARLARWRVDRLWIGGEGTTAALHRDLAHNAHTVVEGRKRFWLAAPAHDRDLYPTAPWSSVPNGSLVDPECLNLSRFPRAARVRPWIAELGPGDTLLLPSRWWHHVRTLEFCVSINTFFASGPLALLVASADAAKALWKLNR